MKLDILIVRLMPFIKRVGLRSEIITQVKKDVAKLVNVSRIHQRQAERWEKIALILLDIFKNPLPKKRYEKLLSLFTSITKVERAVFLTPNAETGDFDDIQALYGEATEELIEEKVTKSVIADCIEADMAILTNNAMYYEQHTFYGFSVYAIVCIPLKIDVQIIGIIYMDIHLKLGVFRPEDLELAKLIAAYSADILAQGMPSNSIEKADLDSIPKI